MKLNLSSSYRHLLAYPRNLTWSFVKTPPPSCLSSHPVAVPPAASRDMAAEVSPLALTTDRTPLESDSSKLLGRAGAAGGSENVSKSEEAPASDDSGTGTAPDVDLPSLNLNFALGRNTFATMLVRELIKRTL